MARKAIYQHATQVNLGTHPDDGTSPVGSAEWNEAPDPQGMYGNTPATSTITIASGVATPTDSVTVVTSESSTTDVLDKLATTNTNEYELIYLFANTGHTITLTHTESPNADGQVVTVGGANETLSTTKPTILMRKGTYWYGYGGGTVADGSITTAKIAANAVDGTKIALTSDAAGDIMYYDGTNYVRLAKGSANEVLQMGGSNAPEWGAVAATEIAAGAVDTSELAADAVDGTKIADNAIANEHLADNAVGLAEIASGTDGELITWDASGDPAAVAVGTATHVLTSNGAGAAPTFQAPAGGGASLFHLFANSTTTTYVGQSGEAQTLGTAVGTLASGSGNRDVYIRKIDTNNEGIFTVIHKNGALVEVQLG